MTKPGAGLASVRGGGLERLDVAGQLLITSDGTVTPMLELMTGEPIITSGLTQCPVPLDDDMAELLPAPPDTALLYRTTQLVGAQSGTVYVDASSVVQIDALPSGSRTDLLMTTDPIGQVLRRHRVESFRELLAWEVLDRPRRPGDRRHLADFRATRRYRIFISGSPALVITERFSAECFSRSCRPEQPGSPYPQRCLVCQESQR